MDYEVVIPAAYKDYNKIEYLASSLHYLNPQPKRVIVIHDQPFAMRRVEIDGIPIIYIQEREVLDLDPTAAKLFRRPQWIYQQFLKLFQNVTKTDNYLILDSDIILNKKIELLNEDGKPKLFLANDQNHKPYFRYSNDMFGFGREYDHSFITEIMLMKKSINNVLITEHYYHMGKQDLPNKQYYQEQYIMLNFNAGSADRFAAIKYLYELTCMGATDNWIPADYEIYGNFIHKEFPRLYVKEKIKSSMRGKYQSWTNEELKAYIEEMKGTDYDTFTAHTWI